MARKLLIEVCQPLVVICLMLAIAETQAHVDRMLACLLVAVFFKLLVVEAKLDSRTSRLERTGDRT